MAEQHSLIGASSAYRWINCPGSVALYRQLTERKTTEYALIGTVAHTICELCLTKGKDPVAFLGEKIVPEGGTEPIEVTEDMVNAVAVYVGKVRLDKQRFGGKLGVETSFDLSWLHPGMFGRNDACLMPEEVFGTLRIYDYKNGRKEVNAEGNVQCMYYALGALGKDNLAMAETVVSTIVQPNAFGKDPVDSWEVSVKELYDWGNDVLLPAAKATEAPDAPCHSGDWCVFCEAAHLCQARQKQALELLDPAPDATTVAVLPSVKELTPERIGQLSAFFTSGPFTQWVKALAAEEQAMLASGVRIPGRKLVETEVLGNRKWADEGAVTEEFADLGGDLLVTKVKTPAQVEKVLQQRGVPKEERESRVAKLVTRDVGKKFIVVSENDDRVAVEESHKKAIELF